ncbi:MULTISPECIES: OsmC family protein [unclassified Pseudonocardia]|jgi:organic hydroperoxide reductase OsmC/OhrA|uniref:OsmC family protein n=1 Tax=unclassified Pseudonocardia TaxID=2619320 RepID=UPI00095CE18A|nr:MULTISPECIES: OsmC family protein [unclassified Pseudonocardia]MBN9099656.1 OsmC family protein [Pseudonocardia sp.]OJY44990.1 MAG: osmotically inducible protein OsmC [Pseudonocardia sp. 73-21]
MTSTVHQYAATCTWSGSTAAGYRDYDRTHDTGAGPHTLTMSSDPAFLGDPARLNPEQLVVMAAASCQLLSFLAVAARARLDVRDYRDDATAGMSEENRPMRLDEIVLRPHIVMASGPSEDRVRHLVEVAHKECFIANSLSTPVRVEPTVEFTA